MIKNRLNCKGCTLSVGGATCQPVSDAILDAVKQPGLGFEMRYKLPDPSVARLALGSMIVGDAARAAGEAACTNLLKLARNPASRVAT